MIYTHSSMNVKAYTRHGVCWCVRVYVRICDCLIPLCSCVRVFSVVVFKSFIHRVACKHTTVYAPHTYTPMRYVCSSQFWHLYWYTPCRVNGPLLYTQLDLVESSVCAYLVCFFYILWLCIFHIMKNVVRSRAFTFVLVAVNVYVPFHMIVLNFVFSSWPDFSESGLCDQFYHHWKIENSVGCRNQMKSK